MTTGRIAIEGAFRADELGSSIATSLRIKESLAYFDHFSLDEGFSLDREYLAMVFLDAIANLQD